MELDEELVISASAGDRLLDRLDATGAGSPLSFGCRSGDCASCRVRVVAGAELLEPPLPDEIATLQAHGAGQDERLACQIVVGSGDGLIRLFALSATRRT